MGRLGEALRAAREDRGLSLSDVEVATRIRRKHLAALEVDDFAALPAPIYVRGYIRAYAQFVGLDPDEMVARFTREGAPKELVGVIPEVRPLRMPGAITGRTLALLALLLVLGGGGYYVYGEYSAFVAGEAPHITSPIPNSASAATTAEPIDLPAAAATAVRPTPVPTPSPMPSPTPIQGVHVEVKVIQPSWLRVVVDGQPVYTQTAQPGATLRWDGQDSVVMRTGNAGGVEVTFNGKPQGTLGARGEVKDVQWTATR